MTEVINIYVEIINNKFSSKFHCLLGIPLHRLKSTAGSISSKA